MCGIAGIFGRLPEEKGLASTRAMVRALRFRGPDGEGVAAVEAGNERRLFLGHARLSILDLTDHASQPMVDPETGSWLVFNGELYNFAELRGELEAAGHRFRSSGDTEVLLHALIRQGPEAVKKVRGMYAYAFWHGKQRKLYLGRDPFGIKPLLLARAGDLLLFASEARALRASRLLDLTVDPTAVRSYLAFGAVSEPASIFQEIVMLPPGHVVTVDEAGRVGPPRSVISLSEVLARTAPRHFSSRGEVVQTVQAELQRAVRDHLVSDVPVGVFLSGGIDSSLVAALSDRTGVARELRYLTVCFSEQEFSELGYAAEVACQLAGRHEIVRLDAAGLVETLPRALSGMDQPTIDGINTFIVSRVAAQQGIKVVLSGLGGDEVFGGYTTFQKAPLLSRFPRMIGALGAMAPARLIRSQSERMKLKRASQCFNLLDAYLLQRSLLWDADLLGSDAFAAWPDPRSISPEGLDLLTIDGPYSDYQKISYFENSFYMRNQLLRDSDIMGATNSIELRVPFVDLKLLELAWSIPASYHGSLFGGGKRILKEVLRQMVPRLPVNRPKMGFVLPWRMWLKTPQFSSMIEDTFNTPAYYSGLGIAPSVGPKLLQAFRAGDSRVSWMNVWSVFVLLDWKRRLQSQMEVS